MPKYNGHKNWNHWNVSLWINSDEALYRLAQRCIQENPRNRDKAARDFLKRVSKWKVKPHKTPDGAPYTVSSIRAAMVGM